MHKSTRNRNNRLQQNKGIMVAISFDIGNNVYWYFKLMHNIFETNAFYQIMVS